MRVLLVPPDTRPPTLAFPRLLAQAAGCTALVPPAEALPRLNRPGDGERLATWLRAEAATADVLIVSLETLCLGGLIPARRVDDPAAGALARLELLPQLKAANPRLRILASGVIVRVAHGDDPFEEKPYYGRYGPALRAYGEAYDRRQRAPGGEREEHLSSAEGALPSEILEDWLAVRRRSRALHLQALELARQGVLEHLCLTLDDTAPYGLAAVDRRALEARCDALGLWDRVDIYPGADETPLTLLARVLQDAPTRVYLRYAGVRGPSVPLRYEDRPAGELIAAHLRAAGCLPVDTVAEAELVLAVNSPAVAQGEPQPDYETVDGAGRYLPAFLDFIADCLVRGVPLTVADIAYANGAEQRFTRLLYGRLAVARLAGFSAWNTAGNTVGSALAMGVTARRVRDRRAWLQALFGRFVDDDLYQGRVRAEVARDLGDPDPFDLGERQAEAERALDARLAPLARELWQAHFAAEGYRLRWAPARLAWPRLFTGVFPFALEGEGPDDG